MGHLPERNEKDCLNCGAIVQGRYCHLCGQENVIPREGFWSMVLHFFYDIMHYDSKFYKTVGKLVFRPGYLSTEYMQGRRARYLHPVKMYVFTSAVFFIFFFSVFKPASGIRSGRLSPEDRARAIASMEAETRERPGDTALLRQLEKMRDTTYHPGLTGLEGGDFSISLTSTPYKRVSEYDSAQLTLPRKERDGWIKRRLVRKEIELNARFRENPGENARLLAYGLLHRMPYMLFVSLPLFALLLKLVYIRRKQFFYVDHGIFTIHLYIFSFLVLLAVFALNWLGDITGAGIFTWLIGALFFGMLFYLYKAMRNFYGQRRAKTVVKFLIVSFFSLLMMLVLLVVFMFLSAFTI